MTSADINLVPKLVGLFDGDADVRCAWGGRGSGKTRSFALMCAVYGYRYGGMGEKGIILCARQFQNSLVDSSMIEIKRAIEGYEFLREYYEIGDRYVRSRDGNIEFQFIGLDRNISSVKSMGRILLCWVDEAEPVTESAWDILLPTLREEGNGWHTELWVTWNPLREDAAVEKLFRSAISTSKGRIRGVEVNWRDNPLFPSILNRTRELHLQNNPDTYRHVWEGGYLEHVSGAYYAREMSQCEIDGRICSLKPDPLMMIRCFWDIGGTGAKSDATAIWVAQFVDREIWVLDYYEAQGQPLSEHIGWLHTRGYSRALMVLPHDGATKDRVYNVSYQSALISAGFQVHIVPNQGAGAVRARIDCVRRMFSRIYFNESTTKAGRKALSWYHEKWDENRRIGLGAEHDWSSHGADAFGLMCIAYEKPVMRKKREAYRGVDIDEIQGSWMSQ